MLGVALEVFAELGYDGASTREIAARAGVNRGLIPYYFGNKEALWKEAVNEAFAESRAGVAAFWERHADSTPVDRDELESIVRGLVSFAASNPAFNRFMTEEGKRDSLRMQWLVDTHERPVFEAFEALLDLPNARNLLTASFDVASFYYILVGATSHVFHQSHSAMRLTGQDPTDPAAVKAHADALIALFLVPRDEPK